MGDGAFRTGSAIVRERAPLVVWRASRHRRTWTAGAVAGLGGGAATVTEVLWHWAAAPWPLVALGLVLIATACGAVTADFRRAGPGATRDRGSGGSADRATGSGSSAGEDVGVLRPTSPARVD